MGRSKTHVRVICDILCPSVAWPMPGAIFSFFPAYPLFSLRALCINREADWKGLFPVLKYTYFHMRILRRFMGCCLNLLQLCTYKADDSGPTRFKARTRLRPLENWYHGFKSYSEYGCVSLVLSSIGGGLSVDWSADQGVLPKIHSCSQLEQARGPNPQEDISISACCRSIDQHWESYILLLTKFKAFKVTRFFICFLLNKHNLKCFKLQL
jgi:hypothetical protein